MATNGLTPRLGETLSQFADGEPRTTTEVAERLDLGRRATYDRLDRLVEGDHLETKKVGANARVWWRPVPAATDDTPATATSQWEQQFRSLVDATEEYAIFLLDPSGRVRTWNPGAERIKGYDADEIIGDRFSTFYTDEAREAGVPSENLAAAAADGSTEDEGWRVRADGSRFWAHVTITALRDDEGELTGYAKVTRDMTERREYERRLERQRDDLRGELDELFGRIDDAFFALDEEWRFTHLNDRATALLERPVEDLVGSRVWDAFPAAADSVFQRNYERAMETQESVSFEAFYDPLDSWFEVTAYPSDSGLSVYFRDVTERKEREQRLERYERIFETIDDGVYVVDTEGRFRQANEAYASMVGLDREDLVGRHVTDVVDESVHRAAKRLEAQLRAGERETATLEAEIPDGDGNVRVGEATFSLLAEDDDFVRIGVVRDVTERRERERELERQRERLAALNSLNDVVRDITDAVVGQSTREEIERAVCERLAAAPSYRFAYVCEVDASDGSLVKRVECGVDGYLDDIPLSVDPEDPAGRGPLGRAIRTRETTVANALEDPEFEPWREYAREYDYRSSAAIPIVHDDILYGVIGVYADRPAAFDGEERQVVDQLGEVVGQAIAATERKEALMSDEVVELDFRIRDVFGALSLPDGVDPGGRITLDDAVPTGDGEFTVFGTAADAGDLLTAVADRLPHWDEVVVRSDGDPADVEVHMTDPPVLSTVASLGGSVEHAVVEDGDCEIRVQLAPSVEVRRLIDAVESAYPEAELLRRRQVSRASDDRPAVTALSDSLTDRQRATLAAAYHAGFFEWPRDVSGEEMADALGVAAPTFHQHLRKAERKVFASLFDAATDA